MGTGAKIAIGCAVVCVLGCLVSCGIFFVWAGTGSQGGVRYANNPEAYAAEYIESHHLLESDESLVAYYDASFDLDASELYILTNRRVISSHGTIVSSLPTSQIRNITKTDQGAIGTLIVVQGDNSTIAITVAPLNGADGFYDVLMSAWQSAQRAPAPVDGAAPVDGGAAPMDAGDASTR